MDRKELRIVAAAIQVGDKVYQGKRHGQIMQQIWSETPDNPVRVTQDMQGFVASDGKFYNRFQSGAIACRSGQTKHRHETLLSEHLW